MLIKSGRYYHNLWIIYIVLQSAFIDHFKSLAWGEFNFGYETEDYLSAIVNLTYVDPATGIFKQENLELGKLLPGLSDEVTGIVIHVTSNNHTNHEACEKLDADSIPKEPFIALIKHGGCRDQVKLRHVADANASAAVLYSDNHNTRFIKIERKVNRLTFLVINEKKGQEIATLVENGTRVMMRIAIGSRNSFRFGQINRTSVLFVSVSFVILMVISFAWLLFYYVQRFRYTHAKEILSKRLCSAAKKALDKIPIKAVKANDSDHEEDNECCAICIEIFQSGELIRSLPCKHSFHKICIDPWLLEHRSCPICKLDILLYFGLIYTGSQESVLELDDEMLQPRRSLEEQESMLQNQRRNSGVRVVMSRREDRATSPCSLSSLDPEAATADQSFIVTNLDVSDAAVNTSDPPSEEENEIHEERWTSSLPQNFLHSSETIHKNTGKSNDDHLVKTDHIDFEICDLNSEK